MLRLRAADIRAYLDRGWDELARTATPRDVAGSLAVADDLRSQALAGVPGWPSRADRDADIEAHVRLAALFHRAHRARLRSPRPR